MYYFGTNLDNRFKVSDFWPTAEQSHKIPFEKEDIRAEVHRQMEAMKRQKAHREAEDRTKMGLEDAKIKLAGMNRQGSAGGD